MDAVLEARKRLLRKARGRKLLRGLMAGALCAPLGLSAGGAWGGLVGAYLFRGDHTGAIGMVVGALLGCVAVMAIGFTIVIPDDMKRMDTATSIGMATGVLFSVPSWQAWIWMVIAPALMGCGYLGGWWLARELTWLRRRWSWWTRWEAQDAAESAALEARSR